MPSLRTSYTLTKKGRGNSQKSPTKGCTSYALSGRGWRNKLRRLRPHLTTLKSRYTTILSQHTDNAYPPDILAQRTKGIQGEISRTEQHIARVETNLRSH